MHPGRSFADFLIRYTYKIYLRIEAPSSPLNAVDKYILHSCTPLELMENYYTSAVALSASFLLFTRFSSAYRMRYHVLVWQICFLPT